MRISKRLLILSCFAFISKAAVARADNCVFMRTSGFPNVFHNGCSYTTMISFCYVDSSGICTRLHGVVGPLRPGETAPVSTPPGGGGGWKYSWCSLDNQPGGRCGLEDFREGARYLEREP